MSMAMLVSLLHSSCVVSTTGKNDQDVTSRAGISNVDPHCTPLNMGLRCSEYTALISGALPENALESLTHQESLDLFASHSCIWDGFEARAPVKLEVHSDSSRQRAARILSGPPTEKNGHVESYTLF